MQRIEFLLGDILADAAAVIAGAMIEYRNGGLKPETKEQFGKSAVQLCDIWYASRFDSYNAERNAHEPYFENRPPSNPRLNFADAAQKFGMEELCNRFPYAPEPILKELLMCALECLQDALKRLLPPEAVERTHNRLVPA